MNKPTIKQERFILKYFECGNATEAYRDAYNAKNMKSKTISRKAFELLENGKITARLKELQDEAVKKSEWNVEKLLSTYEEVIQIGLGKVPSKHIINNEEIELCNTSLPSVNKALGDITKLLGLDIQKVEMDSNKSDNEISTINVVFGQKPLEIP